MFGPDERNAPDIAAVFTLVLGWVFTIFAVLSLAGLVWARHGSLSMDDCLLFVAFVIAIALVAHTTWAIVDEGLGRHQEVAGRQRRATLVKSIMTNEILWTLVNTVVRYAGASSVESLFILTGSLGSNALLTAIVLHGATCVLAPCLICRPVAAAWDTNVDGTCGNQVVAYVAFELLGALLDTVVLAVPLPRLHRLHMPWQRKAAGVILISAGVLVFIIIGLRVQALRFVNDPDFSFSCGYLGLLSELGGLLAIICCCGSSLQPIFERYFLRKPPSAVQRHDNATAENGMAVENSNAAKELAAEDGHELVGGGELF